MDGAQVWLIHPNKLFREGLKRILSGSPFEVVAEAANLSQAHALLGDTVPGVVLFDLAGEGEAEALREVRAMLPDSRLVILAGELETKRLKTALEAGTDGYLMSDLSPDALIQSLRLVMLGEKVFPTHLAALLISGQTDNIVAMPGTPRGLSEREMQILRHLLKGDSNKMIANRLGITEATVKVHLKTVLRKIGAANRTQAAIWALNHGFDRDNASHAVGN
jgi:two-component system nitrate/nitrite response regulator NarL